MSKTYKLLSDILAEPRITGPNPNEVIACTHEITLALDAVIDERKRQDDLWGEQNHNPYIYFAILSEEIGELAQAIVQTQFGGKHGGWPNVRKEAIHCAAVAVAIIECLDRDKWIANDINFNNPKGQQ